MELCGRESLVPRTWVGVGVGAGAEGSRGRIVLVEGRHG